MNTYGSLINLNVSTRLSDNARIEFSSTFIRSDDPNDSLTSLDNDDFFEVNLKYFF